MCVLSTQLLHRVYELLISSGSGDLAIKKWRIHMQEPQVSASSPLLSLFPKTKSTEELKGTRRLIFVTQISPDGPDKVVVHNFATLCHLMNRDTHHVQVYLRSPRLSSSTLYAHPHTHTHTSRCLPTIRFCTELISAVA